MPAPQSPPSPNGGLPMASFKVAEVVVTSLEAFISAAALNLGAQLPDGRALSAAEQDPIEAWFALLAAGGLMDSLGAMMQQELRESYRRRIGEQADKLAAMYPKRQFPAPAPVVSSLKGLVEAAWGADAK